MDFSKIVFPSLTTMALILVLAMSIIFYLNVSNGLEFRKEICDNTGKIYGVEGDLMPHSNAWQTHIDCFQDYTAQRNITYITGIISIICFLAIVLSWKIDVLNSNKKQTA